MFCGGCQCYLNFMHAERVAVLFRAACYIVRMINCLLALITHPNGLRFENVYVYSKSLNQPKYKFLKDLLEPIDGVRYLPFSEHEAVLSPDEALPNSLMIFDDVACEKQDNVRAYFCMGRHKNVDSFYLCQSYAHVPKHLVRDNVNLLVIFRQDDVNLRHIYDDHVNTDMSYPVFKELCANCWNSDQHSFWSSTRIELELTRGDIEKDSTILL
ncbi:unnamed protein product [Trichogramma brassicae]|uniref:Uncharacterized protein n=1 Tax=Trichogramma brassicae TaxID=86971 RepID=A0A6H5ISL1_9HYME|nr:unnamed protein product [Trichogramma brassicae]